ncbi:MAG: alpha-amylase [Bacteroidales bacterium]|nr:alpha-amylase [Bacteroidales bacterium]
MKMNRYFWIAFIYLFLFSCEKDEPAYNDKGQPEPPLPPVEFEIPATEDIIMYEVNERAFSATGDLQGVIDGLGHIESLSINVIWLMPIHPIGQVNSVNSPYSVQNFLEVNQEYGTVEDLIMLVDKAHEKGMAVILDWVANHTAWDNPWIINTDWYTQDGNGNIVHPPGTNWLDVADLNYDNQNMRQAMIEAMEFWIDIADIDGFRCDAADMVPFDFWKQAIDSLSLFTTKDLIMLAEGARGDHFTAGFDMNFGWEFYGNLKDVFSGNATPNQLLSIHQNTLNNLPAGKMKLLFTTNHDESAWDATPMILFNGKQGALAASVISIFLTGVPLIYDGQEVGETDNIQFFSNDPINWSLNPDMLAGYIKLLDIYSNSETARKGALATYDHSTVAAFTLSSEQEQLFILVNTKDNEVIFNFPDELAGNSWTDLDSGTNFGGQEQVILSPYHYLVLEEN